MLTPSATHTNSLLHNHICPQVTQSTKNSVLRIDPAVFVPNDERVKRMGAMDGSDLRVMSYNVLWGLSAESATTKANTRQVTPMASETPGTTGSGMIAHLQQLPVPIMSRCYREHVLLREILKYGSSVACLQEVTPAIDDFAVPMLAAHGYKYCRIRDGSVRKGSIGGELAVVWKAEQLEDECHATWKLCELLARPWNTDILATMQPHQLAYMRRQPHMVQVRLAMDHCYRLLSLCSLAPCKFAETSSGSRFLNLLIRTAGGTICRAWCTRISARVQTETRYCSEHASQPGCDRVGASSSNSNVCAPAGVAALERAQPVACGVLWGPEYAMA